MVKLQSGRLLNLIAKANGLKCLSGDIGNAYHDAKTDELIYARCGPEFGNQQGCIAIINKALYGLHSANKWHAHFLDTLLSMGFKPSCFDCDGGR